MHPIENIMKCSVEQIKNMVDVNTIVGTPLMTAGETMVVPVSKVSSVSCQAGASIWRRLR